MAVEFGSDGGSPQGTIETGRPKILTDDGKFTINGGILTWKSDAIKGQSANNWIDANSWTSDDGTQKTSGEFDMQSAAGSGLSVMDVDNRPGLSASPGGIIRCISGNTTTVSWNFSNAGSFLVGNGSNVLFTDSSPTNIAGGVTTLCGGTIRAITGFDNFGGLLEGVGEIVGNLYNGLNASGIPIGGGVVHPGVGSSYGNLSITGQFFQGPGGTLAIEVSSDDPSLGHYSRLDVRQMAHLGGWLDVRNADCSLTSGVITFLTYGAVVGDFDDGHIWYTESTWFAGGMTRFFIPDEGGTAYTLTVSCAC